MDGLSVKLLFMKNFISKKNCPSEIFHDSIYVKCQSTDQRVIISCEALPLASTALYRTALYLYCPSTHDDEVIEVMRSIIKCI